MIKSSGTHTTIAVVCRTTRTITWTNKCFVLLFVKQCDLWTFFLIVATHFMFPSQKAKKRQVNWLYDVITDNSVNLFLFFEYLKNLLSQFVCNWQLVVPCKQWNWWKELQFQLFYSSKFQFFSAWRRDKIVFVPIQLM